jgi:hypothetical protein
LREISLVLGTRAPDFAPNAFRRLPGRHRAEVLGGPNSIPRRENTVIGTTARPAALGR